MTSEPGPVVSAGRADANRIAFRVLRALLDGSHSFECVIAGKRVTIASERIATQWPVGLEGFEEASDGPWPPSVRVRCTWEGGGCALRVRARPFQTTGRYRHYLGLQVSLEGARQELLWATLPTCWLSATDGDVVRVPGHFKSNRLLASDTRDDAERLRQLVKDDGMPLMTPWRAELFSVRIPSGEIAPEAGEGFERVVRLVLLKLPFLAKDLGLPAASLPFTPDTLPATVVATAPPIDEEAPSDSGKYDGIWPLPGGVRQYKVTFDALIDWFAEKPRTQAACEEHMRARFELTGASAIHGYFRQVVNTPFFVQRGGEFSLSEAHRAPRSPARAPLRQRPLAAHGGTRSIRAAGCSGVDRHALRVGTRDSSRMAGSLSRSARRSGDATPPLRGRRHHVRHARADEALRAARGHLRARSPHESPPSRTRMEAASPAPPVRADATATPSAGPPLTAAERDALDSRATELAIASVERLASRYARHELSAMWALLDALRTPALPTSELDARVRAALAESASLSKYADESNECGPGFPRDDPGPWHWLCLASLTRAAAIAHTSPHEALFAVDSAAFEATYPEPDLRESERAWRRAQLADPPAR